MSCSIGKRPQVAPYSGAMLPIVARSSTVRFDRPGPKNSTNLPTTPFLLLAAFCYGRSSDRFYRKLVSNRVFGKYLQNYREGRGIPMQQKIITILLLWVSIGSSIYFLSAPVWATLLLIAIASGVSIFLISVKIDQGERELTRETL